MDGPGGAGGRPGGGRSAGGMESAGDQEDDPSSSSSSVLTVLDELADSQQPQQGSLEDDLEQFRQRWKQEVSQQRQSSSTPASDAVQTGATESGPATKLDQAMELYMAGMQLEQRGLLYEAIQKYRRAVQTDAAVEQEMRRVLMARHQQQQQQQAQQQQQQQHADSDTSSHALPSGATGQEEEEESAEDTLRRLQQLSLQDGRCCRPDTPQMAAHISCLPAEVMQLIVCWVVSADLDVRSLDLLALVCRGFYRLARDNALWKRLCRRALGPGSTETRTPTVWRELYLSRPHLHFCGCYISRASYIRAGEPNGYQDQSYRPWHMVHYYRLLRFFPEGVCLMLTTADEPAAAVGQLLQRPSVRVAGPAVPGHYRLKGDRVVAVLSVPREASRRLKSGRVRLRRREMVQYDPGQQMLHIELDVLPFRLAWQSYKVVTVYTNGTEATHAIALNDQYPPLVFSRVRSYTAASEAPLR